MNKIFQYLEDIFVAAIIVTISASTGYMGFLYGRDHENKILNVKITQLKEKVENVKMQYHGKLNHYFEYKGQLYMTRNIKDEADVKKWIKIK